jgi:hypothetical protein
VRKVISASRRTDLVAFFPGWLAEAVQKERAVFLAPSGRPSVVDLSPASVHTFVLWSKNFQNLIDNRDGLRDGLGRYDQLTFHFTITGLGGAPVEKEVPPAEAALGQLEPLLEIAGDPRRISLRFDPVIYWTENNETRSNLAFFDGLAGKAASLGIRDIRFSFAQWYGKSRRRAERAGFAFVDPPLEAKRIDARYLAGIAGRHGLNLFCCSQDFLADIPGIRPSACIDGRRLSGCHPEGLPAAVGKDRTQRRECRCTVSIDIGSYTQTCPHSCIYCYANPRV